jgi:hypothetical protein
MTGALRISREMKSKKYESASMTSYSDMMEPGSAGMRITNRSSADKFGIRRTNNKTRLSSDSMDSSHISEIEGYSRDKNVPFLQRLDNWVWLGNQNEFQQQCRVVHRWIDGNEHVLLLNRAFWVIILSV